MSSTERLTSAAEAYVARALELLRERCPAEGDTALELGFARWREDTQGEGTIARFGSHKIFRLTPDVWEPARVCAVRELARLPDEGMREYRELVDAIAAESLFLGELEPPHERGEMVYRLANRAASFTDGDGQTRRVVLRFMKNAYGARSGIVHSGRLDEAKLRDLDGQRATPARFADDLEELIRRSLRKAVHSVASGTRFPPNWDELLFP
jgi:hypothetical protein